jgi:hypothetical protein
MGGAPPFHVDIVNSVMVRICSVVPEQEPGLSALGFKPMPYGNGRLWHVDVPADDEALAELFSGLCDIDCAFSKVHGTAGHMERLRAAGKIDRPYRQIDWSAPGEWDISEI